MAVRAVFAPSQGRRLPKVPQPGETARRFFCAGTKIRAVVSLTAIVPATNDPPTLAICTGAIRLAEAGPQQLLVVRDADRPGIPPPPGTRAPGQPRARCSCSSMPTSKSTRTRSLRSDARLRPIRSSVAVFGSYDDRPPFDGARLRLPKPAAPPCSPSPPRWPCDHILGRNRRDPPGCVRARRRLRPAAVRPGPSVEDIELGMRLTAVGTQIVLDPTIQGTHLKRWTLAQMVRHRLVPTRHPLGRAPSSSHVNGSSALNLGWRHRLSTPCRSGRLRWARSPAAFSSRPEVAGDAGALEPLVLRAPREAARAGARLSSESGCTRCTT